MPVRSHPDQHVVDADVRLGDVLEPQTGLGVGFHECAHRAATSLVGSRSRVDDPRSPPPWRSAALVRSGEASAREVVEAALRRIEALDPALNAFIEVDGERALAAADAVEPGDAQPFAGVPIAIKGNVSGRGLPAQLRLASSSTATGPTTRRYLVSAAARGGLRDRRHDEPAGVRDPADHRAALQRPDPQPVGPRRARRAGRAAGRRRRSRPGWSRSRTATTAAARSASPRPAAAWWGSSRAAGAISVGPDLGESWLACHGVLTRTVADTAHALDVLGGYEVGDANWAPRPAEPYATAMRRDPGQAAGRRHRRQPARRRAAGRTRSTALRVGAEMLRGARPRGRRGRARRSRPPRCWRSSSTSSGRRSRSGSSSGVRIARPRAGGGRDRAAVARAAASAPAQTPVDRLHGRARAAAGARARAGRRSSPTTTC